MCDLVFDRLPLLYINTYTSLHESIIIMINDIRSEYLGYFALNIRIPQ